MSEIKDGGPAFPLVAEKCEGHPRYYSHIGMSLRDYFIAHAPADPQPWFKPKMPDRLICPPFDPRKMGIQCDAELAERAEDWRRDSISDLDEEYPVLLPYCNAWRQYWKENEEYAAEYSRQRYIQWPVAWADAMIKAREAKA